jgi:hypothetical protein
VKLSGSGSALGASALRESGRPPPSKREDRTIYEIDVVLLTSLCLVQDA